jgi:hypothetical protein
LYQRTLCLNSCSGTSLYPSSSWMISWTLIILSGVRPLTQVYQCDRCNLMWMNMVFLSVPHYSDHLFLIEMQCTTQKLLSCS